MNRCSHEMSSLKEGRPATPAITTNFGTALGLSYLDGPGTALGLSYFTGPGTALGLSFLTGPGTALGLSYFTGPGTALGLSANAGEAAQTKAIVPKRSVLYEVITAPNSGKASGDKDAVCMLARLLAIGSSHRYQLFMQSRGENYP
jgi:hypothetical protein